MPNPTFNPFHSLFAGRSPQPPQNNLKQAIIGTDPPPPVQIQEPQPLQIPVLPNQQQQDAGWRQLFGDQADRGLIDLTKVNGGNLGQIVPGLQNPTPQQRQQITQAPIYQPERYLQPQTDLAALQAHGMRNSGTPQGQPPVQMQAPPPVQIKMPDMPTPQIKPMSQQDAQSQAQRQAEDAHIAGLTGQQQGFYDPFADSASMAQQQQGNYAMGRQNYLQAAANVGQDDRERMAREMALGDQSIKRGAVNVDAQKAALEDATKRAGIASTENIAGKNLTSEELRAKMSSATQLQHALISGRAGILQAQANQKGMGDAALMTQLFSNPEFMQKISAGGDQAKEAIDYMRGVHSRAAGAPADANSLMGGLMGANDPYAAQLSGMGVGQQQPLAPLAPQGQVQVNQPSAGGTKSPPVKDAFATQAGQREFAPLANLKARMGDKPTFDSLLSTLAEHGAGSGDAGDRVRPEDADELIRTALNSGIRAEDLETAAGKRLLLHQRKGGISQDSPYRVASQNQPSSFLGIPFTGPSNNVQVLGQDGKPVFSGSEPAFSLGQYLGGTRSFLSGDLTTQGQGTADRRESDATAALLTALQRRRAGSRSNTTGR